jgi:hypothetical protein
MPSATSESRLCQWVIYGFLWLILTPYSAAQGDPTRIPTADEQIGLVPQSDFKSWPSDNFPFCSNDRVVDDFIYTDRLRK